MNSSRLNLKQLTRQFREASQTVRAFPICNHCQEEIDIFISDKLAGRQVDHLYTGITYPLDTRPVYSHLYQKLAHLTT
jgi:hypothetical protein